jgi:hexokinase
MLPCRHLLRRGLGQVLGAQAKQLLPLVEIKPAHDGSCLGAAVLALAAAG